MKSDSFYLGSSFGTPESLSEAALQHIIANSGFECESFTSGIGTCWKQGRSAAAEYGADQCCPSCIAFYGLYGGANG